MLVVLVRCVLEFGLACVESSDKQHISSIVHFSQPTQTLFRTLNIPPISSFACDVRAEFFHRPSAHPDQDNSTRFTFNLHSLPLMHQLNSALLAPRTKPLVDCSCVDDQCEHRWEFAPSCLPRLFPVKYNQRTVMPYIPPSGNDHIP